MTNNSRKLLEIMPSNLQNLIEIIPVEIDHRIIDSVSVSEVIVKKLGAKNKKQVANFISKKIGKTRSGAPLDEYSNHIEEPFSTSKKNFFYELEEIFEYKDFIFVVKVAIEGEINGNKKYNGCILHIISVDLVLKDISSTTSP